jgi:hypothetical protein
MLTKILFFEKTEIPLHTIQPLYRSFSQKKNHYEFVTHTVKNEDEKKKLKSDLLDEN